jgi:hypothetical protein
MSSLRPVNGARDVPARSASDGISALKRSVGAACFVAAAGRDVPRSVPGLCRRLQLNKRVVTASKGSLY